MAGPNADIVAGNALALKDMPVGTIVHNVELYPGNGAQLDVYKRQVLCKSACIQKCKRSKSLR